MPVAPLPVAYTPQTITLAIDGHEMTFTDVDLNVWLAEALQITGDESLARAIEATLVPVDHVPLRELPPPPAITGQTASATKRGQDPASLALWDYSFTYQASRDEHDEVVAYVEPGVTFPQAASLAPQDQRLFRALARFHVLRDKELVPEIVAALAAHQPGQPPPDVPGNGEKPEATFNIFKTRSATAIVQVVRNRADERFRFVAGTSASIEAPRLSHGAFDLASVPGTSLASRLDAFFRSLLGDAKATVRIACMYRYDDVQVPVVLFADQSLEEGWADMFTAVIEEWRASLQPPPGTLTFHVTVSFAEEPLIDVQDLFISV